METEKVRTGSWVTQLSDNMSRTISEFMTCMEMFGNGFLTIMLYWQMEPIPKEAQVEVELFEAAVGLVGRGVAHHRRERRILLITISVIRGRGVVTMVMGSVFA